MEKSAREAQAKGNAIDAAVYDLKAVNPNAIAKVDTRTPAEIIKSIEAQGKIVSTALAKLKTTPIHHHPPRHRRADPH